MSVELDKDRSIMERKYKNEDIRSRFSISHETVRKYTIDFADFLSDGANPDEKGTHRTYTESDLRAFAVITRMKNTNHTDDDIRATLIAGLDGQLAELMEDNSVALSPNMQITLSKQEITNLRSQLNTSLDELQKWRDKAKRLEGQNELLEKQIEGQANNIELHQKIAVLEYQLKKLRENLD